MGRICAHFSCVPFWGKIAQKTTKKALKSVLDEKGAYVFETGNVSNVALGLMDPLALSKGPYVFLFVYKIVFRVGKIDLYQFWDRTPPLYQT